VILSRLGLCRLSLASAAKQSSMSAKSNMAHLEASAGMAGFAKCIMMILGSATPPNVHLKAMNPHLIVEGYPVYFTTELSCWNQNSGYCGVSSFGIGGTNARGEIVGRCQRGPFTTLGPLKLEKLDYVTVPCPSCMVPMCYLCRVAVPKPSIVGKHNCCLIREDSNNYEYCSDCYSGSFSYVERLKGIANPGGFPLYIFGTWNAWSELEEMERNPDGNYEFVVRLGETRSEEFQVRLSRVQGFYPVRPRSCSAARIEGPDSDFVGKNWIIDGRDDETQPGPSTASHSNGMSRSPYAGNPSLQRYLRRLLARTTSTAI